MSVSDDTHALILYGAGLIAAESCHYLERYGRGGGHPLLCDDIRTTDGEVLRAADFCGSITKPVGFE